MTKKLTLSGPETLRNPLNGTLHIEWYLLGKDDSGYYISWLEAALDTGLPECMAFEAKTGADGIARVTSWRRCDLVFRVSHFEHDDTYITCWDENYNAYELKIEEE